MPQRLIKYMRAAGLLLADGACINISYFAAFLMRFEFSLDSDQAIGFFTIYAYNFLWLTLIKLVIYRLGGLYSSLWRYAGMEELVKVFVVTVIANGAAIAWLQMTQQYLPAGVYAMAAVLDIMLAGGLRFSYRALGGLKKPGAVGVIRKSGGPGPSEDEREAGGTKVMLVGAGDAGAAMIRELKLHPEKGRRVTVAVDDDPCKLGRRIAGVKVAGNRTGIKKLARRYGIHEIIIAIPSAPRREITEILAECNKTRCKLKILPALMDLIDEKISVNTLRDVDIENLLGREVIQANPKEISGYLEGRIVMVTGAGGSIGSGLCRRIARLKPRRLIAVDICENAAFVLAGEMKRAFPHMEMDTVIASVTDRARMEEVFDRYRPHVVFHGAACKHIALMEENPKEAVANIILGTKNLIDLSDQYAVNKFALISTGETVNPANVIGAAKRAAEMLLQQKSALSRTCYSVARLGNVLGSSGSVIPIFRRQIAEGGPLTVTHPRIRRHFMSIPEAVQLILEAGAMSEGGEVFLLDMGEPVKIMDLAENIIRLSGFVPYEDIDIQITGLRPGEKLEEELCLEEEDIKPTAYSRILTGRPLPPSPAMAELLSREGGLEESVAGILAGNSGQLKEWLRELIPNYKRYSENGGS